MVYLLFGTESFLIKEERNKILDSFFKGKNHNTIFLDYYDGDNLSTALDECEQLFLTDDLKAVIYKNSKEIFEEKTANSKVLDKFKNFLENNQKDIVLIFELNVSDIKNTNPYIKLIQKKGNVVELKEIAKKEWPIYVTEYFKKKKTKISQDALNEVINRLNNRDLNYFNNEIEKLLLYKKDDISYDDVVNIVTPMIENDVFSILESLIINKKEKALSSLLDLTNNNHDPVSLIALISTSLIFMDQVALLSLEGFSADEIARTLRANVYRVLANLRSLNNIGHNKIIEKLNELYNLEKKIKHSYINALFGLELFILNF